MNSDIYSSGSSREESARAVTRISRLLHDTEQQVEDARHLSDRLASIRQTCASSDRAVRVTVDISGRLVDLQLNDAVTYINPTVLASTILSCIKEAHESARERASILASEVWGEDSDLTQRMRHAYRQPAESAEDKHEGGASRRDDYAPGMIIGPTRSPRPPRTR